MLARLSILQKVLCLILLVSSTSVVVSAVGYDGLMRLAHSTEEVEVAGEEMRDAERMNAAAIALNRIEYHLAAFPKAAERLAPEVEALLAEMDGELSYLRDHAGPALAPTVAEIASKYAVYREHLRDTLATAAATADEIEIGEAQAAILHLVEEHEAEVASLHDSLSAFSRLAGEHGLAVTRDAERLAERTSLTLVVVAALGTLFGIALGFLLAKFGLIDPVTRITRSLRVLADGDLETAIPDTARRDEVGEIARTTLTFQQNLRRTRELEAEASQQEQRAAEQRRRDMLALAERFDSQVGASLAVVARSAGELQNAASQLSSAVEETGAQSETVAAAAEQASANVRTVASAAEELSASISEVSAQVSGAARQSQSASRSARTTQEEINALGRAIELVESVIAGINDVAEQTNLLALNATIEAARAGEAGKGFAVVATEVKALANQTKLMTDEVQSKVDGVRQSSANAITAMRSIIDQVGAIDEATSAMAAAVEEQSVATDDISRNAAEAASGTTEVSSNIAGVGAAAEQTRRATHVVSASADALAEQSRSLQQAVAGFLAEVRAA